jgi:hypothetical protein
LGKVTATVGAPFADLSEINENLGVLTETLLLLKLQLHNHVLLETAKLYQLLIIFKSELPTVITLMERWEVMQKPLFIGRML